jgi:hypothetical protein
MAIAGKSGRPLGQPKTGGRKKGTPNRATLILKEKINATGCDPLTELAKIAMNHRYAVEVRVRCLCELASYLYPKRKPVDVPNEQRTVVKMITTLDSSPEGCDGGDQPSSEA